MFKGLTIASIIFIMLMVFCQLFLPFLAQRQALALLQAAAPAENATAEINTLPAAALLVGQVDEARVRADQAMIAQLRVRNLDLHGSNMRIHMPSLVFDRRLRIESASALHLQAEIREEDLAAALQKKIDKLKDVQVTIEPAQVRIQGNVPLLGRKIDVNIEGMIRAQEGGIYFHMTQVNIRNAVLGKALTADLFEDVLLADLRTTPFQLEATEVVQKDGTIEIALNR